MKTRALAQEMRQAFSELTLKQAEMLMDLGISAWLINVYQMIGAAIIRVDGDLYAPDPCGLPAFVTPALCHHADTPETPEPWGSAGSEISSISSPGTRNTWSDGPFAPGTRHGSAALPRSLSSPVRCGFGAHRSIGFALIAKAS
jgi:hypothetical protein